MVKYNYFELVDLIRQVCESHPFVNSFYEGLYSIKGAERDIEYATIVLTPNSHNIGDQINIYNFNMLYADRLTRDNYLEVQSVGIDVIREIINALKDCFDLDINDNISINVFKEQFADETAGAITTLSIIMQSNISDCHWINPKLCCV